MQWNWLTGQTIHSTSIKIHIVILTKQIKGNLGMNCTTPTTFQGLNWSTLRACSPNHPVKSNKVKTDSRSTPSNNIWKRTTEVHTCLVSWRVQLWTTSMQCTLNPNKQHWVRVTSNPRRIYSGGRMLCHPISRWGLSTTVSVTVAVVLV